MFKKDNFILGDFWKQFFFLHPGKDRFSLRLKTMIMLLFLSGAVFSQTERSYFIENASVFFVSDASLERIEAISKDLKGVIDLNSNSFAFSVNNTSFKGFNSPLQIEHFNENYVESEKYPKCTFTGKIIDEVDFSKEGIYTVRAKGMLTIKGIGIERIIKSTVEVKNQGIIITSEFSIFLADHEIRIPRIVQQKIAPEIKVSLKAKLLKGGMK